MMNEAFLNSMTDFATACVSELGNGQTSIYNNRFAAVTLNRSLMSTLYQEHGIIQVLIDQPVDDAFRGGIVIRCPEMSADDIKKLQHVIDMMDILETYKQGIKWKRLFGGAGVIINAGQDMTKPFNINQVKSDTPLEFYAADRWELSYTPAGMSQLDQFEADKLECPYNYYGHVLNKTNVIKMMGKIAPSLIRGQFGGWGVSEIEKILRSWEQYVKHQDVTFEILDEAKVDVFKIQGFNSAVASRNGAQLTAQRVNIASKIKNYNNALVVDKEDDYEAKQLSFGGLAEILKEIRIGLACDLRMPMTKLFGLSAAGFNSGEDDIENYNCMIESEIRSKDKQGLLFILKILCQKTFGYVPDTIDFDYQPLREMSSQEQSAVKDADLRRILDAYDRGLMTSEAAIEQINSAEVFHVELKPEEIGSLPDEEEEAETGGVQGLVG